MRARICIFENAFITGVRYVAGPTPIVRPGRAGAPIRISAFRHPVGK
jgi:hypothetical protein